MTRIGAVLLSYFGPVLPGVLLLLFFAAFDSEPPTIVMVAAAVLVVIAALFIRLYFAMWYVRDKGRNGALGFLALFGLLGWIFLIVTEDRSVAKHVDRSLQPAT
ncbi:MAG TPA: hypothetical protein VGQ76_06500 [Thermoanaerobaculia bacterium]|jgi:hypothetical protein|nr:hypothetical protein [Thermoanaerobaculia bacterium]